MYVRAHGARSVGTPAPASFGIPAGHGLLGDAFGVAPIFPIPPAVAAIAALPAVPTRHRTFR